MRTILAFLFLLRHVALGFADSGIDLKETLMVSPEVFRQKLGSPCREEGTPSEHLRWSAEDSTADVYLEDGRVVVVFIVSAARGDKHGAARGVLEKYGWLSPNAVWKEQSRAADEDHDDTVYATADNRFECVVSFPRYVGSWRYSVLLRDLKSRAGTGPRRANQPLQGTPGTVPSSSTEPEARRP